MDHEQLLKRLDKGWTDFKDSYAGLSQAQLTRSPVKAKWCVKDVIEHVTTWEEEALQSLPLIVAGKRLPRYSTKYGGIDAFNAMMTERKRDLSLAQVFRRQERVHGRLVAYIKRVPQEHLGLAGARETRFRRRLRLDTYGHYPLHAKAIRQWRLRNHAKRPRSVGNG